MSRSLIPSLGLASSIFALAALPMAACDDDKTACRTGTGGSSLGSGGKGGQSATGGTAGGNAGATGSGGSARTGGAGGVAAGGVGGAVGGAAGGTVGGGGMGGAAAFLDTDVVFARFNGDGTPDTTFGTSGTGVAFLDLGPGAMVGNGVVRDSPWGIAKDAKDRLFVFSTRKSIDPGRVDADRVVARLSANGALDTSFGSAGLHTLSIGTLSENARHGIVDPDGKVVTSGYVNQPTGVGTQTANRLLLLRLNGGDGAGGVGGVGGAGGSAGPLPGTPDTSFGVSGVVSYSPFSSTDGVTLWGTAEAYAIGRQSTGAYVTTGYGRSASTGTVNVLAFRFLPTGAPDLGWATNGSFEKDIASDNDRGRNLVVLPDDRVLVVGSATLTAGNVDGLIMMLTPNGSLDTTFNTTGYKAYKFDATTDRPDDALFGAAVSPNGMFAAAVGYRNAGSVSGNNDDAALVILPLGGTGAEFAGAVPLSATANDRFWSVTFDANNKIVAAGYVADGTDHWLAVARFNTDGTPDTTFGTGGVAKLNAVVGRNVEEARGVVIQSDGKIVIGGSADHL